MVTKTVMHSEVREIISAEFVSISGAVVAGIVLAAMTDKLFLVPGLFVLLPGFLEMRGSISGSLASRLSSGLFLGALKPKIKNTKVLRGNVIASIVLALITSLVLGVMAYAVGFYIFGIASTKIIYIAVVAALLSNAVQIPLTIFTTFWFYRKGHDPNNIMGPYTTTAGDIISVLSLYAVVVVL